MFDENILKNARRIHFIGIGGSGMFPIVQILHTKGYHITGSDNNETDTLKTEREMGIEIFLGHNPENVKGADLVVYTAAIMKDNPELCAALESGIPTIERSIMLGYLTTKYSDCICVCGTHGKTTTTAMLTQMLLGAGLDPTAVIGGKLPAIGGSGRVGKSDIMVCEACEFVDTFLKLSPDAAVILNIDADHLDYFGTLENIIKSFHKFAQMATKAIIVNGDDSNSMKALEGVTEKEIITFGWSEKNDYYPVNILNLQGAQSTFELMYRGKLLQKMTLHVPGRHNILNAVAACAGAIYAGVSPEQAAEHLEKFRGAGRRFEVLGQVRGVTIADDYAHHPAELAVTLKTAKEMKFRKVWAVFQPFTYSRTYMLMDDFAKALSIADHVVMSEIMGSREKNTYGVYTSHLAEKIPGSVWFPEFEEIADYVMKNAQEGDLVITLGCGDVYKCAKLMLNK
ncbi:UDP-N-acetylmuramate--L-alanine ligase [Youxingia wuxianensis]|uniref:UDP-N-acetylmuramate--L-alanine ligase n=1 Tax=Youxingia wuxianensis TaxID=2763678 RepID=A0A926EKM9_9FIRM|nr:UDP-N-acetylmuramate--L-alanine ligase [Youxingia wuxianensis]MBC8584120.1 UDP-N-acetylmuramate--L-alanine ligase [Youxingia wuxianensis]